MSSRLTLDIPAVGAPGPGYATKVNEALDTLNCDFVVEDLDERDAIPSPVDNAYCLVKNIGRTYRWDEDAGKWMPPTESFVNILDFGAHWGLTDNSVPINAAIASTVQGGGDDPRSTIGFPAPFDGSPAGFGVTNPINLRGLSGLRFIGIGSSNRLGFSEPTVIVGNVTNSNPCIDADNDATPPGLTGAFSSNVTFENMTFYNPAATPVNLSHVIGWYFFRCSALTFADTPAVRIQNSFWVRWLEGSMGNNSGSAAGCLRLEGMDGNPNAITCYLIRIQGVIFAGGPMLEYRFRDPTGLLSPSQVYMMDCDSENQDPQNGMILRLSAEPGVAFVGHSDPFVLQRCFAFDPLGGGPYIAVLGDDKVGGRGLRYHNCGTANAGVNIMTWDGVDAYGATTGLDVFGKLAVLDGNGNPSGAVHGFSQRGTYGHSWVGPASGASHAVDLITGLHDTGGEMKDWLWAVQGEDAARLAITPDGWLASGDGVSGTPDAYLGRVAEGIWAVEDGIELPERTDPAAPLANKARLYAKDNGSGKTQIVARFPSGAVQVIATEP